MCKVTTLFVGLGVHKEFISVAHAVAHRTDWRHDIVGAEVGARLHLVSLLVEIVLRVARGSVDFGTDDARRWLALDSMSHGGH